MQSLGIDSYESNAAWQTPRPRRKPREITSGELGQRLRDLMEKDYAKSEIETAGIHVSERHQAVEGLNTATTNEAEIRREAPARLAILEENTNSREPGIASEALGESEELPSTMKLKAELEANRLLKDAREQVETILIKAQTEAEERAREKAAGILWQAKQNANDIQAEAIRKAMQSIIQAREDIDKYLARKVDETQRQINDYIATQTGRVTAGVRPSD